MATRNFIGVEPPVVRLGQFEAQVVVVGVGGTDQQGPAAGKFIKDNARLRSAQGRSRSLLRTSIAIKFLEETFIFVSLE
jgi:hypothetical protein